MPKKHDEIKPFTNPKTVKLATKLTPTALGLNLIEGLPPLDQYIRLMAASKILIDLASRIELPARKVEEWRP